MEKTLNGYHKLFVHKEADNLALSVYQITRSFPGDEILGITNQMRRAAVSVPANIAEGYTRVSKAEKIRFLNIAQGSLVEVEYFIEFSKKIGYIKDAEAKKLLTQKELVGKLLYGFIKSLNTDLRSQIADHC